MIKVELAADGRLLVLTDDLYSGLTLTLEEADDLVSQLLHMIWLAKERASHV